MTDETNARDKLQAIYPIANFNQGIQWTKKGSAEGLEEKMYSAVQDLLKHQIPSEGVIQFIKLPDGGYELRTYRSRD